MGTAAWLPPQHVVCQDNCWDDPSSLAHVHASYWSDRGIVPRHEGDVRYQAT